MKPSELTPDSPLQKKKLNSVVLNIFDGSQIPLTTERFAGPTVEK